MIYLKALLIMLGSIFVIIASLGIIYLIVLCGGVCAIAIFLGCIVLSLGYLCVLESLKDR